MDCRRHARPDEAVGQGAVGIDRSFVEGVKATYPYYIIRLMGGLMYLSGMLVMAYNTWRTMRGTELAVAPIPAVTNAAH